MLLDQLLESGIGTFLCSLLLNLHLLYTSTTFPHYPTTDINHNVIEDQNDYKMLLQAQISSYISFLSPATAFFLPQSQQMSSRQRPTHKNTAPSLKPPPPAYIRIQRSTDKQPNPLPISPRQKEGSRDLQSLLRENQQLRQEIIELKVSQFYNFDDKKLKLLIKQVEELRKDVKDKQQQLDQATLEIDFLKRTNATLLAQLEKDLMLKKKDESQDVTKSTFKPAYGRTLTLDDQITHLSNTSGLQFQNTTLQQAFDAYKDHPSSRLQSYKQQSNLRKQAYKEHPKQAYREYPKQTYREHPLETQRQKTQTNKSRSVRKKALERCVSPFRLKGQTGSESANEYLMCRVKRGLSPLQGK